VAAVPQLPGLRSPGSGAARRAVPLYKSVPGRLAQDAASAHRVAPVDTTAQAARVLMVLVRRRMDISGQTRYRAARSGLCTPLADRAAAVLV